MGAATDSLPAKRERKREGRSERESEIERGRERSDKESERVRERARERVVRGLRTSQQERPHVTIRVWDAERSV